MKLDIENFQASERTLRCVWQPGNGTRYVVYVTRIGVRKCIFALEHWQTWMFANLGEYVHHSYIQEKLGLNKADAMAMEQFFNPEGDGYGEWRHALIDW